VFTGTAADVRVPISRINNEDTSMTFRINNRLFDYCLTFLIFTKAIEKKGVILFVITVDH